jgi:hypothetical protein
MAQVVYQSNQRAGGLSASVTITKPTSLAVGDLMLAQIVGTASSAPTITTLSGWSLIRSEAISGANGGIRSSLFSKIADSTDVAATNFTFVTSGTGSCGSINRLSSTNLVTPIDQSNGSTQSGVSAVSTSGITPTKDTSTFLLFTTSFDNKNPTVSGYAIATENPSWTEAYDQSFGDIGPVSRDVTISMAYGSRNTLTATGNATATISLVMESTITQIINVVPADVVPMTGVATLGIVSIPIVLDTGLAMTGTLGLADADIIEPKWSNQDKSTSAWLNQDKS